MANTKISALTAATTPIAGTAQVPIVQSAATKVATLADIRNMPEPFVMTGQATGSVTAASAGTIKMFSRSYAGRVMPEFMNEAGVDNFCQPALFNNHNFIWSPASGTTFASSHTVLGGAVVATGTGTVANPTIASTNLQTSLRRVRYIGTTTAGTNVGIRSVDPIVWRGNAAGLGGFFAFFRFTQSVNTAATQAFVGLYGATTAMSSTGPGDMINMIGIGYGTGDATATGWQLFRNDASGAAVQTTLTGAPRDTTTVLDLTLYCPANSTGITARVYNQSTQAVVLDNVTYTTDIPASTAMLYWTVHNRNGATTTATDIQLAKVYVESDI